MKISRDDNFNKIIMLEIGYDGLRSLTLLFSLNLPAIKIIDGV